MRTAATVATCAFALTFGVREQQSPSQPQATFRTGVDLVQVDVSVLDRDRRPVKGLTAADFTVREDGKVRPVAAFSAVNLPERPPDPPVAWMRDVAPDVVTNLLPRDGRLVVILLDHSIPLENMAWVRRTAEAAVNQLGPGDLAAVIYTSAGVPQNFTADRSLLRAAINRPFVGIVGDADDTQRGECRCGLCTLEVMTSVADAVRDVAHRRKMVLFIGSAVPVNTTGLQCFAEINEARTKLLRAAGAANLAIHTFDSSLLETLAPTAGQRGVPSYNHSSHLVRQNDLAFYPDETGGRAIKNTNAPWEPVPAVFSESTSYYVLGFVPVNPATDGRYHDIKIDVNRRGVSVHPRKGYYAPSAEAAKPATRGAPPPSLVTAQASIWPDTGMPLGVSVAAFADPGKPKAAVAVLLRAREPVGAGGPTQGRREATAHVNVLAGAYGREGESLGTHTQTITVTPPATARQAFEFEVLLRLELKPGRHEVRVAAEDAARHLSGSVYTYVDVPDFAKAPLSFSGVVLGTTPASPGSLFHDLLPVAPTARREFSPTDRVTAFLRVSQGGNDALVPVTVIAHIMDRKNQTAFEQRTPLFADRSATARSADYVLKLPLERLPAGPYLLTIEAARGEKHTARRDVRFTVR